VHPGPVLTPMMGRTLDRATQVAVSAAVPLRRMADPSEVCYAVLLLASDESSYVTGPPWWSTAACWPTEAPGGSLDGRVIG
jgi:NAD(P)-dependent dehydrogenase (short-subunit alcohol dehydrogenase family)